jgi:oxazoline/thiazoline dehydrogenase
MTMIRIKLAEGVHIASAADGTLGVARRGQTMSLLGLNGHEKAVAELEDGPLVCDELPARWEVPEVMAAIRRMAQRSLLEFDCMVTSTLYLTARPIAGSTPCVFRQLDIQARYLLSRFAYVHRSGERLVFESGRSRWQVTIHDAALLSLIGTIAQSASLRDVIQRCRYLKPAVIKECLRFLVGVGIVGTLIGSEEPEEERIPELAQREFHDVLLHAESRHGLASQAIGGLFPFAGKFDPAPAIKKPTSGVVVDLYQPDLDTLSREDVPLTAVMEMRKSVRQFATRQMANKELGEFLFRVGRARALHKPLRDDPRGYETTTRTYPSGGAAYDIELYVTAWHCESIPRGLYHYEPLNHQLTLVTQDQATVRRIVREARRAAAQADCPQLVITLASRFSRLSWKYRGIAYSITLKNAGVLYEAMYLVATAMGLAPCGLGSGNAVLFSEATGLDPLVESSVGEFMVGVPKESADAEIS